MTITKSIPDSRENGNKMFTQGEAEDSIQFRADDQNPLFEGEGLEYLFYRVASDARYDELPLWGTKERDRVLRSFLRSGPTLARGVVYGQVAKAKNMPYVVDTDNPFLKDFYDEFFQNVGFGRGLHDEINNIATDYLTQDNGAFIELIPTQGRIYRHQELLNDSGNFSNAYVAGAIKKSDIGSFAALDSEQCHRTYNPEYPVIYYNPWTYKRYLMHWTRVITLSQFRQPIELGRGRGLCGLSRAYPAFRIIQDLEIYVHEKLTGNAPEIFVASGMSMNKLQDQLRKARETRRDSGFVRFKDPVIVGSNTNAPGALQATIEKVGLRDVPDGFDFEQYMRIAVAQIAIAFGETPRGIGFPGMSVGETKADAEVTERGATKKGADDILNTVETAINQRVMLPGATLNFDESSDAEDAAKSQIEKTRAETLSMLIDRGVITPDDARKELIALGAIEDRPVTVQAPQETSEQPVDETPEMEDSADSKKVDSHRSRLMT